MIVRKLNALHAVRALDSRKTISLTVKNKISRSMLNFHSYGVVDNYRYSLSSLLFIGHPRALAIKSTEQ